MNENAYRARAERGEVQIGTWITMIRTPGVLTLLAGGGPRLRPRGHGALAVLDGDRRRHGDAGARARLPDGGAPARGQSRVDHAPARRGRLEPARPPGRHARAGGGGRRVLALRAARRSRGMYGFGPHTQYRTLPPGEHMAAANARVHVTAMLETQGARSTGSTRSPPCPASTRSRSGPPTSPRTSACSARRSSATC